ncbi:MAG TPA: response regulator [Pyrinomonadaceae bacterium]|nr:response regulator [Pyrinomonadaceae bacterium]
MRLDLESAVSSPPVFTESAAANEVDKMLRDGIAAAQNGDRRAARLLLDQVTSAQPYNADAWLWLASISEYPEELMVFLDKVLEIDPQNQRAIAWQSATSTLLAKTHLERGVIAFDEGDHRLAEQCFDAVLEADERNVDAFVWKAKLAKDDETKVALYRKVLELDADNAEAREAVAAVDQARFEAAFLEVKRTAANGDYTAAEIALEELLAERPDSLELWMMQVHLAASFEGKFDAYNKMLEIDESNAFARAGFDYLGGLAADVAPQVEEPVVEEAPAEEKPEGHMLAQTEPVDEVEVVAEQPTENEVEFASQPTAESVDVSEAPEMVEQSFEMADETAEEPEEPRSFVSEEIAREADSYASPEAETREYSAADEDLSGYIPQVEGDDYSIHETEVPETAEDASSPWESVAEAPVEEPQIEEPAANACCYCSNELDSNAFECHACGSVMTLSDIERLLAAAPVRPEAIRQAVASMESQWNNREFSCDEIQQLAVGQFNLKNHDLGFAYLQEALRHEPNNVILAGQINALQIRLDEIRRHNEEVEAMPKGRSILVVDDSATVRKLISNKLEKSGHVVACAEDGVEAMEWIGKNKPDLVLLDIAMPRMDGYQVCKLIRSNDATKDVPVVMISGKDGFFDKVRGRMAGTTGYITKPFGPETLMRALDTYLVNEPQAESAPEPVAA